MKIAVLMTCHDRKETTLRCLRGLLPQLGTEDRVFAVDDGSTDGTGEEIVRLFDSSTVRLIQGDGTLYWAKGMRLAWETAAKEGDWDAYLWLNDDVMLDPDGLRRVCEAARENPGAVIVGAMREAVTGKKVYGVMDSGLMTGNVVLVPRSAYDRIGMICAGYRHAWADCDYSLRCGRAGVKVAEVEPVGTCEWHGLRPNLDGRGLSWRCRTLFDPKGWCVHDVWLFRRRNFGVIRALASSVNLVRHVLLCGWNAWWPLYWFACALPRWAQKNLWRGLRLTRVDRLLNDEGYCRLQLLGCTGERLRGIAEGGGINSIVLWQRLRWKSLVPKLCCDKLEVRRYVTAHGLESMLNRLHSPTAGWASADEIDFDALPDRFVLKCSQGSGMNLVVRDKARLDVRRTRDLLAGWLRTDFSRKCRERQYGWFRPRILCERLIDTENGDAPLDYKLMCSDGRMLYGWIDVGRFSDHRRVVFDGCGNAVPGVTIAYAEYEGDVKLPGSFRHMVAAAEKLSCGIPLVRVDFYDDHGMAIFGEMTFTSDAGCARFDPFSFSQNMARQVRVPKNED